MKRFILFSFIGIVFPFLAQSEPSTFPELLEEHGRIKAKLMDDLASDQARFLDEVNAQREKLEKNRQDTLQLISSCRDSECTRRYAQELRRINDDIKNLPTSHDQSAFYTAAILKLQDNVITLLKKEVLEQIQQDQSLNLVPPPSASPPPNSFLENVGKIIHIAYLSGPNLHDVYIQLSYWNYSTTITREIFEGDRPQRVWEQYSEQFENPANYSKIYEKCFSWSEESQRFTGNLISDPRDECGHSDYVSGRSIFGGTFAPGYKRIKIVY